VDCEINREQRLGGSTIRPLDGLWWWGLGAPCNGIVTLFVDM
jgi:hypothetical protein